MRTRPVALAGIMGGKDSETRESSTEILLEAAHFDPPDRSAAPPSASRSRPNRAIASSAAAIRTACSKCAESRRRPDRRVSRRQTCRRARSMLIRNAASRAFSSSRPIASALTSASTIDATTIKSSLEKLEMKVERRPDGAGADLADGCRRSSRADRGCRAAGRL